MNQAPRQLHARNGNGRRRLQPEPIDPVVADAIDSELELAFVASLIWCDPDERAAALESLDPHFREHAREVIDNPSLHDGLGICGILRHLLVFAAVNELHETGQHVGADPIARLLLDRGRLGDIGGAAELMRYSERAIDDAGYMAPDPRGWARTLSNLARRREALAAIARAQTDIAAGRPGAPDELRGALELLEAAQTGSRGLDPQSIDQIFEGVDEAADNMLGDHLLEAGELCLVIGQQGIGKSRVVFQLAIEMIIGCSSWMGAIEIKSVCPPRILIIQLENSRSRIRRELAMQLRGCTAEQRQMVSDRLRIHVPDTIQNRFLPVDDPPSVARMTATVKAFCPDIVVFDPYSGFFAGESENDAVQTRDTLAAQIRIAQAANPKTAVIVVHHARSGRTAAAGAIGWDKGSFARGSKAMTAIARAQINIAPGSADDSDLLVISCGKASNGRPFDTFAVRLDSDRMIYTPDTTFDLDQWREEVSSTNTRSKQTLQKLTPEVVRLVLERAGCSMKRKDLVTELIKASGCKSSVAYARLKSMVDAGDLLEGVGLVSIPIAERAS